MEKLRILFAGYCEDPPICFVLMGNFLSSSTCSTSSGHLRQLFKSLAEMIKEFPNLVEQAQFVFVPGPSDSGFCNILPRSEYLVNNLRSTIFLHDFVVEIVNELRFVLSSVI